MWTAPRCARAGSRRLRFRAARAATVAPLAARAATVAPLAPLAPLAPRHPAPRGQPPKSTGS